MPLIYQAFERAAGRVEVLSHEELFIDLQAHRPRN